MSKAPERLDVFLAANYFLPRLHSAVARRRVITSHEAFTYYGHREKLRVIGKEELLEPLNRNALKIAGEVADESGALLAGNICNTNIWEPGNERAQSAARAMFEEKVGWAVDAGVDFVIGETFCWTDEALAALEVIKQSGRPSVITFGVDVDGLHDGVDAVTACRRVAEAGADVVGLNCSQGPATMLPRAGRKPARCGRLRQQLPRTRVLT